MTVLVWPVLVERGWERTAALTVLLWLLAWAVVLAATVEVASAAREGRVLGAAKALRVALKRMPALVALLVTGLVVVLVIALVAVWAGSAAWVAVAGLGAIAAPLVLAVPTVVAGGTAARALSGAYPEFFALPWAAKAKVAAVVAVPCAVVRLLLEFTPREAHPAMWVACAFVTALMGGLLPARA
ncbi:hypothetical protein ACIBG8_12905 [Nonomuraea sp. NPDC050556]|uniref:hypothetical protein n=1 Tax=Nonomuraea sp. NPDC050556 TaxID=3364369 RepID=UPI0037B25EBB